MIVHVVLKFSKDKRKQKKSTNRILGKNLLRLKININFFLIVTSIKIRIQTGSISSVDLYLRRVMILECKG